MASNLDHMQFSHALHVATASVYHYAATGKTQPGLRNTAMQSNKKLNSTNEKLGGGGGSGNNAT